MTKPKQNLPLDSSLPSKIQTDQELAQYLIDAKSVPAHFKSPADLFLAIQASKDYGISISAVLTNFHPIQGKLTAGIHILTGQCLKNGVKITTLEDAVPVTHYITRGKTPVVLSSREFIDGYNKYEIITASQFTSGEYDKSKIPLIHVPPPYIDDGATDLRTTINIKRWIKIKSNEYDIIDETVSYYLHEAYQALYIGKTVEKPKDNWLNHTLAMMWTRGTSRLLKRYCSDLIHQIAETSEVADTFDVDYTVVNDDGKVKISIDNSNS